MMKKTTAEERKKKKTTKFGGGVKKLFKKLRWKKKTTSETKYQQQPQETVPGEKTQATKKSGRSRISALRNQRDNAAFYDESTPLVEGQENNDGSSTHTNTSGAIQVEEKFFEKNLPLPSSEDDANDEDQDEFIPSPLSARRKGRKKTRFSTVVDSVTINDSQPASVRMDSRMDSSLRSFLASENDPGNPMSPNNSSRRKVGRLSEKLSKLIDLANLTSASDDNETPKDKANKLSLMRSLREESMGISAGSLSSITSDDDDNNNKYSNDETAGEETIADLFVSSIRSSIPYAAPIMNSLSRFSRISVMQSLTKSFYSGSSIRTSSVSMLSKTGRTRSSMMKWATQYRYSEGRPVVDEKSHYVARTKWGIWMERILIPWSPSSTESLVTFLLFFSISQTIPMAITRYREGRWKMVYMQQALVNWILKTFFGMEAPFGGYIFGVHYPRDEDNPTRPGIDWVFGLHLAAGMGWILAGSLQTIFTSRISKRNHRKFGYVASFFFALHMIFCLWALFKDIVQHHTPSKVFLFQGFAQASLYFMGAILAVRNGDVETHRDLMVKSYLISIEGSGTIRFVAWMQYIVGNAFMSQKARLVFDTIQCQSQFVTASAFNCVFPYAFRLQGMRLVTLYFNVLYLRTPEKAKDITSRQLLREEIWEDFIFYAQTVVAIIVMIQLDAYMNIFDPVKDVTGRGYMLQMCGLTYYTYRIITNRFNVVKQNLLMPRRNAVDKSAMDTIEAVRKWAELTGDFDSLVRISKGIRRESSIRS